MKYCKIKLMLRVQSYKGLVEPSFLIKRHQNMTPQNLPLWHKDYFEPEAI